MSCQWCARQQFVKAGREGCAGLHGRADGDGATDRPAFHHPCIQSLARDHQTLWPLSLRALSLSA